MFLTEFDSKNNLDMNIVHGNKSDELDLHREQSFCIDG
jgi:hypothetical protein